MVYRSRMQGLPEVRASEVAVLVRTKLAALDDEAVIGIGQVAQLLELSPRAVDPRSRDGKFPRPVATLAGFRAWLLADVVAYKAGRVLPTRADNELNDDYLDPG